MKAAAADRIPGLEFHPIATRAWYDLGPIDATGRDGAWIVDQVREAAEAIPDWDEALVRLRVKHITRDVYDTLDRSGDCSHVQDWNRCSRIANM